MPPLRQVSTHVVKSYDRSRTNGYDTGVVRERQREQQKSRERRRFICEFLGNECPFMRDKEHGVFRNIAELKYVSLIHL